LTQGRCPVKNYLKPKQEIERSIYPHHGMIARFFITSQSLERIFINGGKRGFLVEIDPRELQRAFEVTPVHVAVEV
jgi:hypothetical protein